MKKVISFVASLMAIGSIVCAQDVPSGVFDVKPSGTSGTTNIDLIVVRWVDQDSQMTLKLSQNSIQEIVYQAGEEKFSCINASVAVGTNSTPASGTKNFTNINPWISFAKDMKERFVRPSPDVYVETIPFDLVGETVLAGSAGSNSKVVIFKGGKHLLAIPGSSWKGNLVGLSRLNPKRMFKGAPNYIGFTTDGSSYFPVVKQVVDNKTEFYWGENGKDVTGSKNKN